MVCIVANSDSIPHAEALIEQLKEIDGLASVILNINRDKTNVVLGKECKTLFGSDYITDELCGLKFNLSPLSFIRSITTERKFYTTKLKNMPHSRAVKRSLTFTAERVRSD